MTPQVFRGSTSILTRYVAPVPLGFGMMVTMTSFPPSASVRWLEPWTTHQGEERAKQVLLETWGSRAQYIGSAPGMLTIIGDYTDIGGGTSLPTVTPHRAYVAVSVRDDETVRISLDPEDPDAANGPAWEGTFDTLEDALNSLEWYAHPASAIWQLLERGYNGKGVDIAVASCLPEGTGLSLTTAATVGTIHAMNDAWGLSLPTGFAGAEVADIAIEATNSVTRWATVGMAQHVTARCADGQALYVDFSTPRPEVTPCPLYFPDYGLALLVTVTSRPTLRIGDLVNARMAEVAKATSELGLTSLSQLATNPRALAVLDTLSDPVLKRRARHVITESERSELVRDEFSGTGPAHERFVAAGKAMFRSHASLELDFEVSTPELNLAVDTAFRTGALGARMAGPGGGGYAVTLLRRAQAESTARAIAGAFASHGMPEPTFMLI